MKKKILAWTAAIIIVALVSAAFLRPVDPNPDFSEAAVVYVAGSGVPITDCIGDTQLLTAKEYVLTGFGAAWGERRNYMVKVSTEHDLALTAVRYVDEIRRSSAGVDNEHRIGYVERLVDGEWRVVSGIGVEVQYVSGVNGQPPYVRLSGEAWLNCRVDGLYEPGEYRFTHYFRENVSDTPRAYTTGEELYSISYTIAVPEPGDKPCSLLGVFVEPVSEQPERVNVSINVHSDTAKLYSLETGAKLEKRVGLFWKEVTETPDGLSAVGFRIPENDDVMHFVPSGCCPYIDDLSAEYRLTLEFVEVAGEDFSDKTTRTLTLNLKFGG